jgi:hypothetical protein
MTQHVVAGDAVLDASQAAGVLREIAADGAELVARGIGRVEQAVRRDGAAQVGVEHARLDHDVQVVRLDEQDLVELGECDGQGAVDGRGPARQTTACAPRDHRDPVLGREAQDGAHILGAAWEGDTQRMTGPQVGGLVPAIRLDLGRVGQQA